MGSLMRWTLLSSQDSLLYSEDASFSHQREPSPHLKLETATMTKAISVRDVMSMCVLFALKLTCCVSKRHPFVMYGQNISFLF